jgi:3-oxoadipate enol-lactonase
MKLEINGALLNVVESGDPTTLPVTFIHGFPFSHAMWHHQLEPVAREFRAIAFDVRGLGDSEAGDGVITIESHVDDLIAILDSLDVKKTVIVGLSMGGYVALRALQRNPERFCAAILCDTRSDADSNEGRLNRAISIADVKQHGSAAFAEGFLKKLFAPESFQRIPKEVALIRDIISRTPSINIARMLLALAARTDTTDALESVTIPTLIMVGDLDPITPPDAAQAMHERIRGSKLRIIPGAAHMSPLESPAEVNKHLLAFLKGVSGNQEFTSKNPRLPNLE